MAVTRCRVEAKYIDFHSYEEKEKEFKKLLGVFCNRVNKEGIKTRFKQCQYFESKSQKKRRKQREREIQRHKEKLRDNFVFNGGENNYL